MPQYSIVLPDDTVITVATPSHGCDIVASTDEAPFKGILAEHVGVSSAEAGHRPFLVQNIRMRLVRGLVKRHGLTYAEAHDRVDTLSDSYLIDAAIRHQIPASICREVGDATTIWQWIVDHLSLILSVVEFLLPFLLAL